MGTTQSTTLNEDSSGKATGGNYGGLGDGNNEWFNWTRIADGGIPSIGATTDASASGNGSVIGILKYIRSLFKQEDSVHASADFGLPSLGVRNDTLAAQSSATGDYALAAYGHAGESFSTPTPPQTATQGAAVALLEAQTTALAASLVIKSSPGTLYKITGYNNNAAVRYLQIANVTALAADGTTPAIVWAIPANSTFELNWGIYGRRFSTGIVACFSTTLATKTIAGADMWLNASYK